MISAVASLALFGGTVWWILASVRVQEYNQELFFFDQGKRLNPLEKQLLLKPKQKQLFKQGNNVIAGFPGTGKTTCALELIARESKRRPAFFFAGKTDHCQNEFSF